MNFFKRSKPDEPKVSAPEPTVDWIGYPQSPITHYTTTYKGCLGITVLCRPKDKYCPGYAALRAIEWQIDGKLGLMNIRANGCTMEDRPIPHEELIHKAKKEAIKSAMRLYETGVRG